jgi:SAM-dependent methyltransferase
MLDVQTYRANELLAKSMVPHWRIAQTHNLDHFERAGFPVRIDSVRELGPIFDTMQENRFANYMSELGGLSDAEYDMTLAACRDAVIFQMTYLPHREPVLPISTLLSALALYKKLCGVSETFKSVLEIGPGCGYLSFFLKHHRTLTNYSQIEACESFYILQNLINIHCFAHRCDERALPHESTRGIDVFAQEGPVTELSSKVRLKGHSPCCHHYPWWRIGELVSQDRRFDLVTSNANLLEFNPAALDDYLAVIQRVLSPAGALVVQCTGFPAQGTDEQLLDKMHAKGFAPLFFVQQNKPIKNPLEQAALSAGTLHSVQFDVTNALFVRSGHPLFGRYHQKPSRRLHFAAAEPVVGSVYFERPPVRRFPTAQEFQEDTERALSA